MSKKWIYIIPILLSAYLVIAWTPTSNINMQNFYSIISATNISANHYYYNNGSELLPGGGSGGIISNNSITLDYYNITNPRWGRSNFTANQAVNSTSNVVFNNVESALSFYVSKTVGGLSYYCSTVGNKIECGNSSTYTFRMSSTEFSYFGANVCTSTNGFCNLTNNITQTNNISITSNDGTGGWTNTTTITNTTLNIGIVQNKKMCFNSNCSAWTCYNGTDLITNNGNEAFTTC
jgi:hypothetical protein